MANKIVTMQDASKANNLLPRTKLKAISDDSGNYLSSGLEAADLNQLDGKTIVSTDDVANNLETTTSGKVLDARQGKLLNDHLSDGVLRLGRLEKVVANIPTQGTWASIGEYADLKDPLTKWSIGTEFTDTFTKGSSSYTCPWRLNAVSSVELQDGTILAHRPWLQMKYTIPDGVQFSHQRAFLKCPSGLAAGTYTIHFAQTWSKLTDLTWSFTLANAVPEGGRVAGFYTMSSSEESTYRVYVYAADGIELLETVTPVIGAASGATDLGTLNYATRNGNLNSMQETAYGWNKWSTSAYRQYLNSSALAGAWWTAQDGWDIRPDQLSTLNGFLYNFPTEFVSALKTIKVTTYLNTVQEGGGADVTYDKVFLPALNQMYINPQISGEGEENTYWQNVAEGAGLSTKFQQYQTYEVLKQYSLASQSSSQYVFLRSANRGFACYVWVVNSSGYVDNGYAASYAFRAVPLVVL